jgi:hypothetical protein
MLSTGLHFASESTGPYAVEHLDADQPKAVVGRGIEDTCADREDREPGEKQGLAPPNVGFASKMVGIGASLSGLATGEVVDHLGYRAAFLTLGGVPWWPWLYSRRRCLRPPTPRQNVTPVRQPLLHHDSRSSPIECPLWLDLTWPPPHRGMSAICAQRTPPTR